MSDEKKNKVPMQYRFLGNSGLRVSALSFGTWNTFGKMIDEETAYQCSVKAVEAGCNFFDCAEAYAAGEAEAVLGRVIKRAGWKRSSLVIATKIFWGGDGPNDQGLSRKHLLEGTDASLKRLGMDYVDLLFAHRPDDYTPMEEVVRAMSHLVNTGKVLYWGTSEWSVQQIEHAMQIAEKRNLIAPIMEQPQYNMLHRERFEVEYEPLYKHYKYGTTIWSPLAYGLLTGKYNKGIPAGTRFDTENTYNERWKVKITENKEETVKMLEALGDVAKSIGCTQSQLALLWCLKNPNVSTVITGSSKPAQVEENFASLQYLDKLTDDVMAKIEKILNNKPKPNIIYRNLK